MPTEAKEQKAYWSDCGQIFFCDGKGYGPADTLQTVCLGNEQEIKNFLEGGQPSEELSSLQRQILIKIQEYRKEQSDGVREGGMERAFTMRTTGYRKKNARHIATRKGIAFRKTNR